MSNWVTTELTNEHLGRQLKGLNPYGYPENMSLSEEAKQPMFALVRGSSATLTQVALMGNVTYGTHRRNGNFLRQIYWKLAQMKVWCIVFRLQQTIIRSSCSLSVSPWSTSMVNIVTSETGYVEDHMTGTQVGDAETTGSKHVSTCPSASDRTSRDRAPNATGNMTMINQALLPLSHLVAPSTSIASVASTIREVAGRVTTANILDACTLAKAKPGLETGPILQNLHVDGISLMITSLIAFPMGQLSFGDKLFGNAASPSQCARSCGVSSNGGVEFAANLFDTEMDVMMEDDEFNKYAMFVT
ncbi:hypothetical protein V1523DRAFT_398549 [Lipomyces doorenjongii]